jgi:hypothetical protein
MRHYLSQHRLGNVSTLIRATNAVLGMSGFPFCTPLIEEISGDITLEIAIPTRDFFYGIIIGISTIDYFSPRDSEVRD